ncbi:hypothetical protein LTR74_018284 [Friedmanniomyces endolithicus]|nr:hypothetical protein LTR74_018284 [Friedmanniomyces endolithicus]
MPPSTSNERSAQIGYRLLIPRKPIETWAILSYLGQIRSSAQTLAVELEKEGQEIWTGAHPLIMLIAGFCKPRDLRLLASDGRLTDEFLNTVPGPGRLQGHGRLSTANVCSAADQRSSVQRLGSLDASDNTRWLAIYDNHDNPKVPSNNDPAAMDLRKFLRDTCQGSVIVTTRSHQIRTGGAIPVRKLTSAQENVEILLSMS